MRTKIIFLTISLLKFISCNESDSFEVGHIEITPYHDTIIFSDIMDIMNELNNNFNTAFSVTNSDESDENIDDLLSEYQHYLMKAHKQRLTYLEKLNQTRNKVPLLRRQSFSKTHLPTATKYNKYYNPTSYYTPNLKMPPTTYNGPLDLLISGKPSRREYLSRYLQYLGQGTELRTNGNFEYPSFHKRPLPPLLQNPIGESIKPSCVCIHPSTACKQCFAQVSYANPRNDVINPQYSESNPKVFRPNTLFENRIGKYLRDDITNTDNTLNVKIKIEIQPPRIEDDLGNLNFQHYRESALRYEDMSKELASNMPTNMSFNFPIPLNMFGYNNFKINRQYEPLRKINVHKKKSRINRNNINNNRHQKKIKTFPNLNVLPLQTIQFYKNPNINDTNNATEFLNKTYQINGKEEEIIINIGSSNYTTTTTITDHPTSINTTQFENSIFYMANITDNSNIEDIHKLRNSIEFELTTKPNSALNVRKKREVIAEPKKDTDKLKRASDNTTKTNNIMKIPIKIKKLDKSLLSDTELLYWPCCAHNVTVTNIRNITNIILQKETTKAKINMSKEAISRNRTAALEQAVFGKVDWNDIDTVVPTFISFVGKYINGMLTFCSSQICHSMKCEEKNCIHRTCLPEKRFNKLGHCTGSSTTDSVVSLESIMDLPTNVAFEIVDILQDKMFGKLYGKVTICINSKCISVVTSKKTFKKYKCPAKTLNKIGHCPDVKKR